MNRAKWVTDSSDKEVGYVVFCPACKHGHLFNTVSDKRPVWNFDGNLEYPTFSPSMLVFETQSDGSHRTICHSFVRNGRIEFLGDCAHEMRGQTVDLPDIDAMW